MWAPLLLQSEVTVAEIDTVLPSQSEVDLQVTVR